MNLHENNFAVHDCSSNNEKIVLRKNKKSCVTN